MSETMPVSLTLAALDMALALRDPGGASSITPIAARRADSIDRCNTFHFGGDYGTSRRLDAAVHWASSDALARASLASK
jgi:hypothetical protein